MLAHTWDCAGTNDHWRFDPAGHLMDDAGSGGFCLSLVNGVGPAVAMAPYAARMLPRLLLWLEPSSLALNSNRAWQLRGRHDMGAVVVPDHPVTRGLPQPADFPVSQSPRAFPPEKRRRSEAKRVLWLQDPLHHRPGALPLRARRIDDGRG